MLGWSFVPGPVHNAALFLVLGTLSALLMSAAKAGFGGSVGLLSVPLMVYACEGNAPLAAGVLLPVLIACDYVSMCFWLGRWQGRVVAALVPGTVVGIGLGWAALAVAGRVQSEAHRDYVGALMKLLIGVVALAFVALQGMRALRRRPLRARGGPVRATGIGVAAGLASTFAHSAGPITSMYMLGQDMPKGRFVASTVLYYWLANQMKLVPYVALGLIGTGSLGGSAALLPAAVAGAVVGVALHRRIRQRYFTPIVYILLALAGAHFCHKAGQVLWPGP